MEITVSRSHVARPATWLRDPTQIFILTTTVRFSHEEHWTIGAYNLHHHVVFDRTPPWYFPARREAERAQERAERDAAPFEWPWYVPRTVPPEWIVTVARIIESPAFAVTFRTASELGEFEPRMMAAFAAFKRFLGAYGSRPSTVYWRF
jgi:hypothetical protein